MQAQCQAQGVKAVLVKAVRLLLLTVCMGVHACMHDCVGDELIVRWGIGYDGYE